MKLSIATFSFVLVACSACKGPPVPVDPVYPPIDPTDPTDGAARGTCSSACAHMRDLKCPLGSPTPRGASCEDTCKNASVEGAVDWPTTCLLRASSCAAADRCN